MSIWTKEKPEAPTKGESSRWYWFWGDNEKEPVVTQLWPNRCWFREGLWGPEVEKPREERNKE